MEKKLILRGMLSGLAAGLLAFVFARIFAEPQIDKAIAYEDGRAEAQHALDHAAGLVAHAHEHEVFSRTVQANVGIGVGIVAFAIAIGGLYAVAFTAAYQRVGAVRARTLALLVALGGFVTVFLVPFLKYPASPPAVGDDETITERGALYLSLVAASVIVGVLTVMLGRQLRARYSAWTATLLAGAAFLVAVGLLYGFLPSFGSLSVGSPDTDIPQPLLDPDGNIVFPGFPADVVYAFRLYSVGAQLILWGTLGLVFGPLAQRLLEPAAAKARTGSPASLAVESATGTAS
ncbi:MAG: CbtA family protein [Frankia sp.]|nr:CbtA family protein [Frankia sp.]